MYNRKPIWGGDKLTVLMSVQEQAGRIPVKDVLVPVLEKGQSIHVHPPLLLLISGVRGQSGVRFHSVSLVLMWLTSVLMLIMAKKLRLACIWVALSLAVALMGSLPLGGPTRGVPIVIAKLVSLACCRSLKSKHSLVILLGTPWSSSVLERAFSQPR